MERGETEREREGERERESGERGREREKEGERGRERSGEGSGKMRERTHICRGIRLRVLPGPYVGSRLHVDVGTWNTFR